MTQTATNEKSEVLQPTEGAEMLERLWTEIRTEVDGINVVGFAFLPQSPSPISHSLDGLSSQ